VADYPLTLRHQDGHEPTEVMYNASIYRDTRAKVLGVFAAASGRLPNSTAENWSG
jgi:hypothetical protein